MTSTNRNIIREHNDSSDLDVLLPKNSIGRRCEIEYEVLTPKSTRWQLFYDALSIVLEERGCSNDRGLNILRPELTHASARAVMRQMEHVDINRSLVFFEEHGGMCDCEILMNVDRGDEDEAPAQYNEDDEDEDYVPGARAVAVKALTSLQWLPMLSKTHAELFNAGGALDFKKLDEAIRKIDDAVTLCSDNVVPLKP